MAKSKYETHVLPNMDKIIRWATDGATVKEIAGKIKVSYSAFRKYLDLGQKGDGRYEALATAFARACEVPDDMVEAALFKKTQGYNAKIAKHYKLKTVEYDPDTGKRLRETEELVEAFDEVHVPADTAAQMFWLANRRGERWKYKPEGGDEEKGHSGVIVLAPVDGVPTDSDARCGGGPSSVTATGGDTFPQGKALGGEGGG